MSTALRLSIAKVTSLVIGTSLLFSTPSYSELTVTTRAGTGNIDYEGDRRTADRTNINPQALAVHPDSKELYFIDGSRRIRKYSCDGRIVTIAGSGRSGFNGDSHPLLETNLDPRALIFHPGTNELYFTDGYPPRVEGNLRGDALRIRKIDLEQSEITTVAGSDSARYNRDLMLRANIHPSRLAFHPQTGDLYFIDGGTRIRRIGTTDSSWHGPRTAAGTDKLGFNGDSESATEANINPQHLAFDYKSGELYFIDNFSRIRKLYATSSIEDPETGAHVPNSYGSLNLQ